MLIAAGGGGGGGVTNFNNSHGGEGGGDVGGDGSTPITNHDMDDFLLSERNEPKYASCDANECYKMNDNQNSTGHIHNGRGDLGLSLNVSHVFPESINSTGGLGGSLLLPGKAGACESYLVFGMSYCALPGKYKEGGRGADGKKGGGGGGAGFMGGKSTVIVNIVCFKYPA